MVQLVEDAVVLLRRYYLQNMPELGDLVHERSRERAEGMKGQTVDGHAREERSEIGSHDRDGLPQGLLLAISGAQDEKASNEQRAELHIHGRFKVVLATDEEQIMREQASDCRCGGDIDG